MSKINKIRFVNLNYNYNTMKIDDEKFYLDGENTMFNLRNGGGKSVLVQMIMAPFVNRRYRNIKDRTFESYFTTSTPTHILIEWKLDDGAGYLLTGMMVRKKDSSSDYDSKEKLDIINFIYEYRKQNEYDINSIPVIEEKDDMKTIKSFSNCRKLFEDLKKNKDLKFNYYDMNNPVTTKNYFNKLEEYDINYREWETIIKQINIKESGLSELFTKAKDSNGLVKEWFLPAIENKLKVEEDRIVNYRQLLDKYIKQYKQNKANIDKKSKLELFIELSKDLDSHCDDFIAVINKKEEIKNYIANVIAFLKEKSKDKENEEEDLEKLIKELNDKIVELEYERESIKIYNKQDEIDSLDFDINRQKKFIDDSDIKKNNIIKMQNILECAKLHRQYQNTSRELQEQELELEILNKKNQDNAPRINNLGFTIREVLESKLKSLKEEKLNKIQKVKNLSHEKDDINNKLKADRNEISNLKEKKGSLQSEIKHFDFMEKRYNTKYSFNLFRNIEGYFEENKLLSTDKDISDEGLSLMKERKNTEENIIDYKEKLKTMESEKQRNFVKISNVKNKLENKTSEFHKAENEIEKRKEIIKFIDFEEDKVLDNENIVMAFDMKIDLLKEDELRLKKLSDNINNEIMKLKTGRVLELPKDMEEKLRKRDINITYGMEWLKKNDYTPEENQNIVEHNPFIPYSLIMDDKEIELLQKEGLDIFTSSPISIINRKDLEMKFEHINGDIVDLRGISFLISFNNKLLNESELQKLIQAKEKEAQAVQSDINRRTENIAFYEEKRNLIKYSDLTLEIYEGLKKEISSLKDEECSLRQAEIDLGNNILSLKEKMDNYVEKAKKLEKAIEKNTDKAENFKEFLKAYEDYKKNKTYLERVLENIRVIQFEIENSENRKADLEKEISQCNSVINDYKTEENRTFNQLSGFNIYKNGTLIQKDAEDLISEFNALTKDITSSEKELKDKINYLNQMFKDVDDELNLKAKKYELKEAEYTNETYTVQKDLELKDELSRENQNYNVLMEHYNNLDKDVTVAGKELQNLNKALAAKFNREGPKDKNVLVDKDFKLEIEKIKMDIADTDDKKKETSKAKAKIENNLTSLNEFNDLSITEKADIKIDLNELDSAVGKLKRDLNSIKEDEAFREKNLTNLVVSIEIKDEFKHESLFKEPIQTLQGLLSRPMEFKNQLNIVVSSYKLLIEKLMADIDLIEREEGKILESILEYIKDVHENIEKIDDNSSITIGSKRLKMLNINVSDWEENKELYKIRLKDYIENIRAKCIKALEQNEDIEDIISNNININKLYDEVVGIGTINIKLYKIEEDKQRQITWDEVSKNSGGEGFLSAFVILSSLLSYMRKDESDVFSRKESGKVLIMDNPFAQTSSAHLLKPLIDIAKKSNTQLICFTGLGGDSIYNRFDNIYVLNLIPSKLKSGVKYLISEHTKGEEEKEVMVASRFKIEEQIKLF